MNELLEKTANIKTTLDINPRPVAPNLKIATRICRDCGKVIWEITDIPGLYTMCGCVAIKRFKMMSEKKALKMADQYRYPGSD